MAWFLYLQEIINGFKIKHIWIQFNSISFIVTMILVSLGQDYYTRKLVQECFEINLIKKYFYLPIVI